MTTRNPIAAAVDVFLSELKNLRQGAPSMHPNRKVGRDRERVVVLLILLAASWQQDKAGLDLENLSTDPLTFRLCLEGRQRDVHFEWEPRDTFGEVMQALKGKLVEAYEELRESPSPWDLLQDT